MDDQDNLLDLHDLDEGNFDPVFADNDFLKCQDELNSDQNASPADKFFDYGQPEAGLPNGEHEPLLFNSKEFLEERKDQSNIQNVVPSPEPVSHDQPQETPSNVEHRYQHKPNEF